MAKKQRFENGKPEDGAPDQNPEKNVDKEDDGDSDE